MSEGDVDASEAHQPGSLPSSFGRAFWAYPSFFAILFGLLGGKTPLGVLEFIKGRKDRNELRKAAQQSLKIVSSIHALLTTYLAAKDVFAKKWTRLNLITTQSPSSNAIVALEAGYLVQDTIVSLLLDSKWSPVNWLSQGSRRAYVRFDPLLQAHHLILAPLLTLFLEVARRGRERGAFFVEMFLLMNASTPSLNLRWWLAYMAKSAPARRKLLLRRASVVNDVILIATFFACRIGLIYYMLWLYGVRTQRNVLSSYLSIPLQCKTGTAGLLVMNSIWWLGLLQKTVKRRWQGKVV